MHVFVQGWCLVLSFASSTSEQMSWSGALSPVGPCDGTKTRSVLGGRQGRESPGKEPPLKLDSPAIWRSSGFQGFSFHFGLESPSDKNGTANCLAKSLDSGSHFCDSWGMLCIVPQKFSTFPFIDHNCAHNCDSSQKRFFALLWCLFFKI